MAKKSNVEHFFELYRYGLPAGVLIRFLRETLKDHEEWIEKLEKSLKRERKRVAGERRKE